MTMTRWMPAAGATMLLSVAALFGCTACAPDTPGSPQPQVQSPADDGANDSADDSGNDEGQPDGPADPAQDTRIDGVAVSADGPSPGNLFISLDDDGSWCKGATLFWSPTVADGVFFTIEDITGQGLQVQAGDCGDLAQCLGQELPSNQQLECSIRMTAGNDFEEVTPLAMTGSITCPTAEICAEVRGRVADSQEQLWVCSPSWVADGNDCSKPTDGG